MWCVTAFLFISGGNWLHEKCCVQVDVHVSSEGRKAPGARTYMEFGALFWLVIWHYDNRQGVWPSLMRQRHYFLVGSDTTVKKRCGNDSVGEIGGWK